MLIVDNISKEYEKEKYAINNISFNISSGEIVGFLGNNGAGKTTTLKILTGIMKANGGNITLNGYTLDTNPLKYKKLIGFMSDEPNQFLRLTGIEYLNFMADMYEINTKHRKERITTLSRLFFIYDDLNKKIESYSLGMKQKIFIIGSLIHNPKLWILDEPLKGLDAKSAYTLKQLMRNHAKQGNSVLFSNHIVDVSEKICDKFIIINHGKIIFDGTLNELKNNNNNKSLEDVMLKLTDN